MHRTDMQRSCCHEAEARYERNREIAKLVREIKKIDSDIAVSHPSAQRKKPKSKRTSDASSETTIDDVVPFTPIQPNCTGGRETFTPPSAGTHHAGSGLKKRDKKIDKRTISHAHRVDKAALQAQVFRGDEIELIKLALHPLRTSASSSSSSDYHAKDGFVDAELQAKNLSFIPIHRHELRQVYKRVPRLSFSKNIGKTRLSEIFQTLQITETNPLGDTKTRKALIAKLIERIANDARIVEADEAFKREREAGFWRLATSTGAKKMRENHTRFSWATGDLLKAQRQPRSRAHSMDHIDDDDKQQEEAGKYEEWEDDSDDNDLVRMAGTDRDDKTVLYWT